LENLKTGIIIQARLGSTRLPEKLMQPFYKNDLLIDIILKKFSGILNKFKVILATTTNPHDDRLAQYCKKYPVDIFRGPEDDVLKRFIMAAERFEFDLIIRVCADNPFFDVQGTLNLLNFDIGNMDYISYKMNDGTPSIKSHLGFWGEVVKLGALKSAHQIAMEKIYFEHVTNYLYSNPAKFSIHLADAPENIGNRNDIRLTLDTKEDYELQSKIFDELKANGISPLPGNILSFLDSKPDYKLLMKSYINSNKK